MSFYSHTKNFEINIQIIYNQYCFTYNGNRFKFNFINYNAYQQLIVIYVIL